MLSPDIAAKVVMSAEEALKACWYQKFLQRILRPQEMGFYVFQTVVGGMNLGIHPDLINSPVLTQANAAFGSVFIPTAYVEGSPAHPAYPSGHATFMGAVVTMLKAFYNDHFVFPNPLMPSGGSLVPYPGAAHDWGRAQQTGL